MAKYYLNRKKTNYGDVYDSYEAIADKPEMIKLGDEEHPNYPFARMAVHRTAPSTSTNWNFRDEPSDWAKNYPKPAAIVDKAVGVPNLEKHLSGRLGNIYETTVYAADSLRNEKDINSKEDHRAHGIEYAKGIRELKKGTSELFSSTPEEVTVTSAFSHTKMRHAVPIMAAMAHQQWGSLTASADLSPHSSRMVKKAKELNLPIKTSEENPRAEVTNSYFFHDPENVQWEHHSIYSDFKEIPSEQVQSARKHLKDIRSLSKPKPKAMGPQFTQMQLPGMEG